MALRSDRETHSSMPGIWDILLFAALGLTAGTLSGLFGIGGGMVIVPGLFYLLRTVDIPYPLLMHMAAGTSMCIMLFTATSSATAHHLRGDVHWRLLLQIVPAIAIGVTLGKLMSYQLATEYLECIFGLFLLFVSLKILLGGLSKAETVGQPKVWLTNVVGIVLGFKSGVLGIGGGAISVPFLLYSGLPMSQASGTSAAFTLPIAVVGTVNCLLMSSTGVNLPLATGAIYWPAVALVGPFAVLGAPIGTSLCHKIASERLKRWFALFLLFLGLRLLFEAAQNFISAG